MPFEENLGADKADGTDSTIALDANRGGSSRVVNRGERVADEQLTAQIVSTPTPGDDGGDASECGLLDLSGRTFTLVLIASQRGGHEDGDPAEARDEQRGRDTPDPHSTERGSRVVDQAEDGNHGPVVQQPSEITPERTSVGAQGGEAPHD